MADAAETAARAMAESASEDEDEGDMPEPLDGEADEVVIDDDSLYDGELGHTSAPERAIDTADGSPTGPGVPNSPRSALKGTATAASTKRRQDAIIQLIQFAVNRSKSTGNSASPSEENSLSTPTHVTSTTNTSTDPSSCFVPAPLVTDGITWLLASDLYDCHTQLSKLQSQMRVLEQRLTAQEAAADEAIERLCLQCRHVEYELNEARQRLQTYLQGYQQNSTARADGDYNQCGSPKSDTLHKLLANGNHDTMKSKAKSFVSRYYSKLAIRKYFLPPSESISITVNAVSPGLSIWSSSDLDAELAGLSVNTLDPGKHSLILDDIWITEDLESPFHSTMYSHDPFGKLGNTRTSFSPVKSSPIKDNWTYLRGPQQRVRLTSSGGLARRRPPTRVVVSTSSRPCFSLQMAMLGLIHRWTVHEWICSRNTH
ncbi:hypothetical protein FBUS_06537 [Fasciolopsis buskii]|uniref:Uncharacterized protein n=1 Tax=Fasciolopsis buskii TaxID=27845 RepID=A0A8E0VPH8_9TREM|nr:hypothetical protein FBUS_06537 [Fasciolopsis buski]